MLLTDEPEKIPLPFAAAGAKNAIPETSQIGITPGAASLTDGFPPLTRTAIAAGGVPPSGLDMNGILYEISDVIRWANAGGGYVYDATFATDANVGGYPKGARVLRSDGLGYWFNTVDDNETDPESAGAIAAGWVPDFTTGAAAVTMTNANVTLTELQYGRPIIILSGLLTGNLNLIFPNIVGQWLVVNNCTGAFTVTAKTAAGTGVVVTQGSASRIYGDATNIATASGPFATDAEAQALTNSDRAITPVTLKNSFKGSNQSLLANGYQKIAGGLILQWGSLSIGASGDGTATFPIAFPNSILKIFLSTANNASFASCEVAPVGTTSTNVYLRDVTGTGVSGTVAFLAIGW